MASSNMRGAKRQAHSEVNGELDEARTAAAASGEDEDETIRRSNAYLGSNNTIGSVHQRKWFLTLDKSNSGFVKSAGTGRWKRSSENERGRPGDWNSFYVRGRDHERSVVTGRLAADVMADEGVSMYKGRKMWQPILE